MVHILYNNTLKTFLKRKVNLKFNQNRTFAHLPKNPSPPVWSEQQDRNYRIVLGFSGIFGVCWGIYSWDPFGLFKPLLLNKETFVPLKLAEKKRITNDTILYQFEYPHKGDSDSKKFLFPLISHVHVKDHTMQIMRPYSILPISGDQELVLDPESGRLLQQSHSLGLLVKKYPQGPMSNFLAQSPIGSTVEIRGPFTTWDYPDQNLEQVVMIAGGTGIVPFYQLLYSLLGSTTDKVNIATKFTLLYYNSSQSNVLLRNELDNLQKSNPDHLSIQYCVDDSSKDSLPDGWWVGRVSYQHIQQVLKSIQFQPKKSKILVCGSDGFQAQICGSRVSESDPGPIKAILGHMGLNSNSVIKF